MSFTIFHIFFFAFKAVCFVVHNSNLSNLGKILCNLDFFSFKFHWYTCTYNIKPRTRGSLFFTCVLFSFFFGGWVVWVCFFYKKGVLGELSLYLFYFQDSVSVNRAPLNVFEFFFLFCYFL